MEPAEIGDVRAFICHGCKHAARGIVRGVAVWDGFNAARVFENSPVEYVLLQCDRCGEACVQGREYYGYGFDEPTIIYPAPRRLSRSIPDPLRREWDEARICFEAKAYAACLVMVRRTIEGTCSDHGIKKQNLAKSLQELQMQGLIDGTLAEWGEALRIAGNQGAHYTGRPVAREDAEDALAFAEALLDHAYVLRKRFAEFQKRLAERKAKPAP